MTENLTFNKALLQEELDTMRMIFIQMKKAFSYFGLNPTKFYDIIFILNYLYVIIYIVLGFTELSLNLHDPHYVVDALRELGYVIIGFTKLTVYKLKYKSLNEIYNEVNDDYSIMQYNSEKEVRAFLSYVATARKFIRILVPATVAMATYYFCRYLIVYQFSIPVRLDSENQTVYILPFRVRFFVPLKDVKTYIIAYIYFLPLMINMTFSMVSDSTLMLGLLAHVCGQLSALYVNISTNVYKETFAFRKYIAKIVARHVRIIKMVDTIESIFSILMLQQVLSITLLLCFFSYSIIVLWGKEENTLLLVSLGCLVGMGIVLLAFCYAGQCLIDESLSICEALYNNTAWYILDPLDLKYYFILLHRARFPLVVTGYGFYLYSLSFFVTLGKSTMAYFSIMRNIV